MSESAPIAEMSVEEVLNRWPRTAEVFTRHNMACVGCPVAPFYTISEAAGVYQISVADFLAELELVIIHKPTQD